jgi:hypothetical protein
VLLYAGINIGLLTLSRWVESNTDVYPYRDEDWLRYLLPTLFEHRGDNRIMLVGESAVRENLLYERFNRAFPTMSTFNGGLSLGTVDDTLISLEYIKRAYGREALPRILILGISPRFVANLPENRPFLEALERYSPYFGIEETPSGPRLKPKTPWQAWSSWIRFILLKQQKRYNAALVAIIRDFITLREESGQEPVHAVHDNLGFLLEKPLVTIKKAISRSALADSVRRWASPYKYHHLQPSGLTGLRIWLRDPGSWWRTVHSWNPATSQQMIADRFSRLRDFAANWEITLYVINLPENVESRKLYDAENYHQYLHFVKKSLATVPFLDLREMLTESEFYDVVHATLPGARRVTESVIHFIKDQCRCD